MDARVRKLTKKGVEPEAAAQLVKAGFALPAQIRQLSENQLDAVVGKAKSGSVFGTVNLKDKAAAK